LIHPSFSFLIRSRVEHAVHPRPLPDPQIGRQILDPVPFAGVIAELLYEEGRARGEALIPQRSRPFDLEGATVLAALAAVDDPVEARLSRRQTLAWFADR
jgi:hypothetical protein